MKGRIAAGIFAVLAVLAVVVPLPLLVIAPGSAVSVGPRVELGRPPDPLSGSLLLTTVRIFQPSALGAVRAWLADHEEVRSRGDVVPEGVDTKEYEEAQRELFRESSEVAAAVGLRAAGQAVDVSGAGARVANVVKGSPASEGLGVGDVITAIDGQPVKLASDLVAALASRSAGDEVVLTVRRQVDGGPGDGKQVDQEVRLRLREVAELGRPALGVAVTTVDLKINLPFPVQVDQGEIGGPSAGLMIALTVYDLTDPADLTRGRTIAGTGTIDLDGEVGPVGGVDSKVVAAEEAGASLFLVPRDEAAQAQEAAGDDLEVVPVGTVDDALTALRQAA
ncbi:MAG: YlbL family protein [Acidimicrobiales bacterium]